MAETCGSAYVNASLDLWRERAGGVRESSLDAGTLACSPQSKHPRGDVDRQRSARCFVWDSTSASGRRLQTACVRARSDLSVSAAPQATETCKHCAARRAGPGRELFFPSCGQITGLQQTKLTQQTDYLAKKQTKKKNTVAKLKLIRFRKTTEG